MKFEWIKIEKDTLAGILDRFRPKIIHPDSPEYVPHWQENRYKCVNGIWVPQFGKMRYVPGRLGFFGVYGRMERWADDGTRMPGIAPDVRDLEWHRAYHTLVCDKFSGFRGDDKYTCDYAVPNKEVDLIRNEERYNSLFDSNGRLKKFVHPLEYLLDTHEGDMGLPLYYNPALNQVEGGCHAKGTLVRMLDGTLKPVEDIKVGDKLSGLGGYRTVKRLCRGTGKMYRIVPRRGNPYIVNEDHILHLGYRDHKGHHRINISVKEYLNLSKYKKKNTYSLTGRAYFEEKELPLHPYFIGLWLGDGFKREKLICYNPEDDKEIEEWLISYAESEPERFSYNIKNAGKSGLGTKQVLRFRLIDKTSMYKNGYWAKTFFNNKHIPDDYLYGSVEQRQQLLAGLIDSDGSYDKDQGRFTFTNTDLKLVKQVESLCKSLGFKVTVSKNISGITDTLKYSVRISGYITQIPCRVSRKKAVKNTLRQGMPFNNIKVEELGTEEYYGFELDGDKLYLLEDYTITHNSRGGGKALRHGSDIFYEDRIGKIEDVKVGDRIYGADGKLTTVTGVFPQGITEIYRITFRSGRTIECCGEHLWSVSQWKGKYTVKKTSEIFKDFKKPRKITDKNTKGLEFKYRVPNNKCLDYSEKVFPADPYFIGVLLGDGHCSQRKKGRNKIILLTCHKEDYQCYIDNIVLPEGINCRTYLKKGTDVLNVLFSYNCSETKLRFNKGTHFFTTLEELGLVNKYSHEKRIPEQYFFGSREQRLRLLRGLMDTDGWVEQKSESRTSTKFATSSPGLAEDFIRLVRSLGIVCHLTRIKNTTHKNSYEITLFSDENIFFLKRKKDKVIKRTSSLALSRSEGDIIINVEKVNPDFATCIMVDNEDKLFLTSEFIVTHNSYFVSLGEILYDICFDGEKTYNIGIKVKTTASLEITSAGGGKATELLQKAEFGMKCLASPEYPELGVWSSPGKPDYEPCPFWKFMSGSIAANNRENPWKNADTGKDGGKWDKSAIGTGSVAYNTAYANNQVAGGLKSAGGRRTRVIHEEGGVNVNLLAAWDSNEGLVTDSGIKMASQKAIGTSGDMTAVVPFQELFTHPKDRKCLVFEYPDEDADGEYGFFIPVYMVDEKFKDADGNTDIEAAKAYHLKEYEEKASASDPNVFINHRMNYPIKIADMWVTGGTGLLPSTEAEMVEKKLMKGNMYQKIGTPIKLYNDSTKPYGVGYDVIQSGADPIYDFPFNPKRENFEGCVMMYINPDTLTINGIIPEDMCIITHDPYYNDEGGVSIGATHVWVNPKYIPQGKPGNCLAATYIGRHPEGTDGYNKVLELLVAFYGNPVRSLWYEADKEKVRAFFLLKKKLNLLCLRPKYEQGSFLFDKQARYTGFLTGDAHTKRFLVQQFGEWLLKKTTLTGPDGELQELMNIERIPCIFTLRQIKLFTFDKSDNFDAISSAYAFPLALAEMEHYVVQENERKKNPMRSLQNLYIKKAFPNGKRNVRNNSFKRV